MGRVHPGERSAAGHGSTATRPRITTDRQVPYGPVQHRRSLRRSINDLSCTPVLHRVVHVEHCATGTCASSHINGGRCHLCGNPLGDPAAGKWPACALPLMVASAGHLPTAPPSWSAHSRTTLCRARRIPGLRIGCASHRRSVGGRSTIVLALSLPCCWRERAEISVAPPRPST